MTAAAIAAKAPRRFSPPLIAGVAILALLLVLAAAPQVIAPRDPLAFDYSALLSPPSAVHPFGTDNFGRDVLSRTIFAARIDLEIALFATTAPAILGSLIGLIAGYVGGLFDVVVGRVIDLVLTFPFLVIVIAIVAILGPGLVNMYVAVALVGWVFYARLMRAEVLVQRQADYVAAARVLGYGPTRVLFRHVLPNAFRPILVYWVTDMALKILLGSSLGYLGLGAQPPEAEWGLLIADGKNFFQQAWWMTFFPGAAIVLAGLGFSLAGDGLADLLEVRR